MTANMARDHRNLIFLVDDDDSIRILLERWIQSEGYDVLSLPSGEACLKALMNDQPAAICLDLNLPGLSGLETLERIREHHPLLPVVVLTADETADSAVRAMKLGAHDYLTKPVDRTKLVTTMHNATEHGQIGRAHV